MKIETLYTDEFSKGPDMTSLGHFKGCDLYHSTQMGLPTVIARYGNQGGMYVSGMFAANGIDVHLTEAKRLSIAAGLPV